MALTQLVRPGAPVILGSFVGAISMRTGSPTFGTAEATQMIFATAQLARRLRVPCRSGGSLCAAKTADAQAAYESANTLLPTLLAGVNLVTHAAGWLEGGLVASYEKFVMDADQCAMMQSLAQGMDIPLAARPSMPSAKSAPEATSSAARTRRRTSKPRSISRQSPTTPPTSNGRRRVACTAEQRANRVWKRMLAEYQDPGIDPARTRPCSISWPGAKRC